MRYGTQPGTLADWASASLRGCWVGWRVSEGRIRNLGQEDRAMVMPHRQPRQTTSRNGCWAKFGCYHNRRFRQVSVLGVKPFLGDFQDLWSRVLRYPRRPSASYRVELEQYLAHYRYHCNVPLLPALTKTVIKAAHFAVVADHPPTRTCTALSAPVPGRP